MKKSTIVITSLISVLLIVVCTIASTYSVIINVVEKEGITEIINEITVRDLFVNDEGNFNNTYYDVKRELDITDEEANILINSESMNTSLKSILNSIVDYNLYNDVTARKSSDEIYNLIVSSINETPDISDELRNKVINKSNYYKQDITTFIYDIEVKLN